MKKIRVVFDFMKEALSRLDHLVRKTGMEERAEVVRRALHLFDHVYEQSKKGDVLIRMDRQGNFTDAVSPFSKK